MKRDYYEILGIGRDASDKEIKAAYRNIIKLCHPDSPDCRMTTKELHEIQEAYDVLSDKRKKAQYDRSISVDTKRDKADSTIVIREGRSGIRPDFRPPFEFSDIFDIFNRPVGSLFNSFFDRDFFNYNRTPQNRLEIILTREEAQKGGVFEIGVPDIHGAKIKSFSLRIPPRVRSGTRLLVDLEEVIGTQGDLEITILTERKR